MTFGTDEYGIGPYGALETPAPLSPSALPDAPRVWPFFVSFGGQPATEMPDLLATLLDYGDEGVVVLATLMSLFSDARAPADAELPLPDGDRRGWWGEGLTLIWDFPNRAAPAGSLLWLLSRAKASPHHAAQVQQIVNDALAWMIPARLAARIDVRTAADPSGGAVALETKIWTPEGLSLIFQTQNVWEVIRAYQNS
jgi:phage gp46-like protein